MHSSCPTCGSRSATDDAAAPCAFCKAIGEPPTLGIGLARLGWVLLRAKAERQEKAAATSKEKRGDVVADVLLAGGDTIDEARERLRGLDDEPASDERTKATLHALAVYRARKQGAEKATLTAAEWQPLRRMLGLYRPTQIAAMINAACDNPIWVQHRLDMLTVERNARAWLATATQQRRATPKDRKAELLIERRDLLARLKPLSLMLADEWASKDIEFMSVEILADHVAELRGEVAGAEQRAKERRRA